MQKLHASEPALGLPAAAQAATAICNHLNLWVDLRAAAGRLQAAVEVCIPTAAPIHANGRSNATQLLRCSYLHRKLVFSNGEPESASRDLQKLDQI